MHKYFYSDGNEKYGPFSKEELKNKNISRNTKIWRYGMDSWLEISSVTELSDILTSIPPEIKVQPDKIEVSIEIDHPFKKGRNSIPKRSQLKKKKQISTIWIIAILTIILFLLFTYATIRNNSETVLYDEIVANSFDSNEDFNIYIEKFYRDLEFHGIYPKKPKEIIIKFSNLDQINNTTHIHALSFGIYNDDKIEIYINQTTWIKFNKPMRYFLMYHELAHDVLNLDDLEAKPWNEGRLMYPEISSYGTLNMDDFIESFHSLFEQL